VHATLNAASCLPVSKKSNKVKFDPPYFVKLDDKLKMNLEHSKSLLVQKMEL
jgi:hypothetical protein